MLLIYCVTSSMHFAFGKGHDIVNLLLKGPFCSPQKARTPQYHVKQSLSFFIAITIDFDFPSNLK